MAVTVVTPVQLALNTASADLADADSTAIATGADGATVDPGAFGRLGMMVFKFVVTTADTVVVVAGINPPSLRAGLGNLSITMATSDVKYVVVEAARFQQADGKIKVTCTENATTKMSAFILPKGLATIGVS